MNEKLNHQPTPEKSHSEKLEYRASAEHLKHLHEKAERAENRPKQEIENIKKSIESSSISGKEYSIGESESRPSNSYGITKHLKKDAYKRTLKKIQIKLSKPEQKFSKVIHKPVIEKVSEISSKTIARPNGIVVGSFMALVTSIFVLYWSRKNGFSYNYLLFIIVFVGGYIIGTASELLIKIFKKH